MGLHNPVSYALATGAGKDATLALHRARASGLVVSPPSASTTVTRARALSRHAP